MINIVNVTKTFGKDKKAVDNISLTIEAGRIFGFLGPNGAGKTTTIKMLTGILPVDSGKIDINGFDIERNPLEAKRQFGYVPDSPDIFLRLKGIEYLNLIAGIYNVKGREKADRIKELAEKLEIIDALGSKIQTYSHGMRQKLVLIGSLLYRPDVWILDEPMTGLDPKSSFLLKEMMREHTNKGGTVFFSTHVLEVAEKLCDVIAVINNGKILFSGELSELRQKFMNDDSLEQIFLEMTENG